jgi:DNA-binding IclR family transcriptional regulator
MPALPDHKPNPESLAAYIPVPTVASLLMTLRPGPATVDEACDLAADHFEIPTSSAYRLIRNLKKQGLIADAGHREALRPGGRPLGLLRITEGGLLAFDTWYRNLTELEALTST